ELFPFSKSKKEFAELGIRILVSSEEAIQIANDKSACYTHLQSNGIQVPAFSVVTTLEEFTQAADALGYPGKNFCFKPSISNGSRGFRIVSDGVNEADQLFNFKPYNTYITYNQALKVLSSQPFPELLVSEYLPGDEYSVDCLADNGKPYLVVPRRREKMVNGISVQGTFVEDKRIIDYCTKIIEAIGLHGNIGIQVKISDGGVPLLLEINPRVQGTIVSALGAGINLPLLAVKNELGLPLAKEELQIAWGTRFSRYWAEVYY
ncbi:MAG TPA: ATP-grasp domain-containing protein, partial [Flavisolibacter sp.]|nr:ATP-grasp domain-containing protein [Flavisolibacter sp.]